MVLGSLLIWILLPTWELAGQLNPLLQVMIAVKIRAEVAPKAQTS